MSEVRRFQSKPQEVEAIQWDGDNANKVERFVGKPDGEDPGFLHSGLKELLTGEPVAALLAGKEGAQGYVPVPVGHWIVRKPGDLTDHWPIDPDYFAAKYEEVNDE